MHVNKSADDTSWVQTRGDLAEYIELLLQDLKLHSHRWENVRLDTYLEAMGRYAEDVGGYYLNTNQGNAENPTWKIFADILKGASLYE